MGSKDSLSKTITSNVHCIGCTTTAPFNFSRPATFVLALRSIHLQLRDLLLQTTARLTLTLTLNRIQGLQGHRLLEVRDPIILVLKLLGLPLLFSFKFRFLFTSTSASYFSFLLLVNSISASDSGRLRSISIISTPLLTASHSPSAFVTLSVHVVCGSPMVLPTTAFSWATSQY